jgi:hypothetical protein
MNRPPQEADCRAYSKAAAAAAPGGAYCGDARCWYHGHIRTCGGAYEKVRGRVVGAASDLTVMRAMHVSCLQNHSC